MWTWVKGNWRPSGKELFDEMVRLADPEIGGEDIGPDHIRLMLASDVGEMPG